MNLSSKTILVTGGAGFIGSHFIRYMLGVHSSLRIVNVDLLTYCGNLENVKDVAKNKRYTFYKADIGDHNKMLRILKKHKVRAVVNFAAESDNNKAVRSPVDFPKTNVLGTSVLLEAARVYGKLERFHHISTCEVFGQLPLSGSKKFTEQSPLKPRTPYNASKGGADLMVQSYYHTFGLPVSISYCANNYGTHQFPEKVIPVFAIKALLNQSLPVFQSRTNKREWIHVRDHCRAIDLILRKGRMGEVYNIGTGLEKNIDEIADAVLNILQKSATLKTIVPDRPGHDARYLLDFSKIQKELGWKPKEQWERTMRETVLWYRDNPQWWRPLLKKSYAWK